jgi:hypothetical protein
MYAVSPAADALGATLNINGDTWFADTFQMRQYCGDLHGQGFLPACSDTSPGAGVVTVSSSSPARVSGSYRFVVVAPSNYSGLLISRPPPTTTVVEGVFDLAFDDRVLCG